MSAKRSARASSIGFDRSLALARHGSFSALGQLLDDYRDYLLHVARHELRADLAAKVAPSDLVQETFLRAAKEFEGFRGTDEAQLRHWLRQILIYNLRDAVKRYYNTQKRAASREIPLETILPANYPRGLECQGDASSLVRRAETRHLVREILVRLPHDYRRVIELRSLEELSFEDVGLALDRSAEAARRLWARAIQRFALELRGTTCDDARPH